MKAFLFGFLVLLVALGSQDVQAAPKGEGANFQIVKANESQVWRLNKLTGEISVCTLESERLVCSSSTNATEVPKQSYAEREVATKQSMEAEKKRREEARQKDLAFLDRVLEAVRSLISASSEREAQ